MMEPDNDDHQWHAVADLGGRPADGYARVGVKQGAHNLLRFVGVKLRLEADKVDLCNKKKEGTPRWQRW